jgi:predicted nuclease of predicted toxin-antitoxin system
MPNPTPNDVRLLTDENISPKITRQLWAAGVDSVPIRDRSRLRISDHRLFNLAISENRIVATINEADFHKLAVRVKDHPGVAIIPSGGSREEQLEYLLAIIGFLRTGPDVMEAAHNRIVTVNEALQVSSRLAHAIAPQVSTVRPSSA